MKYLFFFVLLTVSVFPQNKINHEKLQSNFALKESKAEFRVNLLNKIENTFSSKLNHKTEVSWQNLFYEVGLYLFKSDNIYKAVQLACDYAPKGSIKFKRSLAEIIITLYPTDFEKTIDTLFTTTNDPTLYSYCVHYYLKNGSKTNEYLIAETKKRFGKKNDLWAKIPQINFLVYYLMNSELETPPLKDILSHNFIEGKTIIYTLQRKDRTYPGITIIKKPNGEFVKDENDSIFYIQQLALSVTNLPGYLSQGNTPQGIFSVVGFYNSPTPSLGPTAAVLTRIPFEVPTKLWYHSTVNNNWNINNYKNLLPKSWKEFLPIYESYYAGLTGRRKIVMHGSVDDLSFYDGLSYAPLTPSKGCITATELWNEADGKNIKSDQAKLMNAFFSTKQLYGFLVVIDIDDKHEPVTIGEILQFIE
ncbi:MAG: hypothetical protein KKF62_09865 [Bacteroidetes bacterium]|nr:hypothetical protein [Bacteroidota bacterium]MBU1114545.1 hypothetical protein [Bacteroidota bacterium]MBU1798618.1 hypothetical protein [Bacteroidota bacterium]